MTVEQYETQCTEAQRAKMRELHSYTDMTWQAFLDMAQAPSGRLIDYVALPKWQGMYIGIESDGYAHS